MSAAEINPYGKVFLGNDVEVEMVIFNEKNSDDLHDVLLKFTGTAAYEAGIDGKVISYEAAPGGNGVDFKKGMSTRMISRSLWGTWEMLEVFLNGKTYRVKFDKEKSKSVSSESLFNAWQKDGRP
jgi:hypothetical protein